MKKLFFTCVLLLCSLSVVAQEGGAKASEKPQLTPATANVTTAYKVELTISEFEGGKRISSHSYTLHQGQGGDWARLRMGSRVPVQTGAGGAFQYIDAGLNVDTRLRESSTGLLLDLIVDMSSITGEQKIAEGTQPVIRQFRYSTVTLLTAGKPEIVNAADDPIANRRVELEIVATKVK